MRPAVLRLLALLTLVVAPAALAAQAAFDAARWREDVRVIATELPARHPDAFLRLPRATWDSAVRATEARLGGLTRNQALVALMELVALVHDGHTVINPFFDPAVGAHWYGVELYRYADGLFIRRASPANAGLAGLKVLRVGRVTSDEALACVARIIPHENEWWANAWAPAWLGLAEVADGLGLADGPDALALTVERNGRPEGRLVPAGHGGGGPIDRSGWTDIAGSTPLPLWRQRPGQLYWTSWDPATRTLYVCYRAVLSPDHGPSNADFWRDVFRQADSLPLARLVLDLRENTGGNNFLNRPVIRGLVARPALDRPDRLFVITGGRTFSAAMNLAEDLERWTDATFVGEPTGNAPLFFGDHVPVPLPASGLTLNVSSLRWSPYDPRDRRAFIAPALFTPLTSADDRAGRDPALAAISPAAPPPPSPSASAPPPRRATACWPSASSPRPPPPRSAASAPPSPR